MDRSHAGQGEESMKPKAADFLTKAISMSTQYARTGAVVLICAQIALTPTSQSLAQSSSAPKPIFARDQVQPTIKALEISRSAEALRVTNFLGAPTSQISVAQLANFDAFWLRLTSANAVIGLVKDQDDFLSWWNRRKIALLRARHQLEAGTSVQSFFAQVYAIYLVETQPKPEEEIKKVIENESIQAKSAVIIGVMAGVAGGTVYFVAGIIKGALIAGPAAGIVSAGLEKGVSPLRQKASLIGNRRLAWLNVWLNTVLFREKDISEETKSGIEMLSQKTEPTRKLLQSMKYDADPHEVIKTTQLLQDYYNEAAQVWDSGNPEIFRHGRAVLNDGLQKTRDYGHFILAAVTSAETFQQGLERQIEALERKSAGSAELLERIERYLNTLKEEFYFETRDTELAQKLHDQVVQHEQALKSMGVSEKDIASLLGRQRNLLAAQRQAATLVTNSLLVDLQYKELNRDMPKKIAEMYAMFRTGFGINYFHAEFQSQVIPLLEQLGIKIETAKTEIAKKEKRKKKSPAASQASTETNGSTNTHTPNPRVIRQCADIFR